MKTIMLVLLFACTAQICISQSNESKVKTKDTTEFEYSGGGYISRKGNLSIYDRGYTNLTGIG